LSAQLKVTFVLSGPLAALESPVIGAACPSAGQSATVTSERIPTNAAVRRGPPVLRRRRHASQLGPAFQPRQAAGVPVPPGSASAVITATERANLDPGRRTGSSATRHIYQQMRANSNPLVRRSMT
jgi:hypothetical protein